MKLVRAWGKYSHDNCVDARVATRGLLPDIGAPGAPVEVFPEIQGFYLLLECRHGTLQGWKGLREGAHAVWTA